MDIDRRRDENRVLRERLDALLVAARHSEQMFSRYRAIELMLLEGASFPELFDTLFNTLRRINDYDAITLALCDPDHELRRLFAAIDIDLDDWPDIVVFGGHSELDRALAASGGAALGAFVAAEHAPLFPHETQPLASVAIMPLRRRQHLIGSLNLASCDLARFAPGMAIDFVDRLAGIVAICFENVGNTERLKHVSLTDALTGVHNRRYFDQRLREEADRALRARRPLSCLFVDIDRFKAVNDRFGHPAGDEVLRAVARRVKAELRMSDALGRYGGEEFAAVLADTDAPMAQAVAERIRAAIEASPMREPGGAELAVTVSVGTATVPAPASAAPGTANATTSAGELAARLLAAADQALYQAKQDGRNRVRSVAPVPPARPEG
jgi:two-component system, cell cycle response regulator